MFCIRFFSDNVCFNKKILKICQFIFLSFLYLYCIKKINNFRFLTKQAIIISLLFIKALYSISQTKTKSFFSNHKIFAAGQFSFFKPHFNKGILAKLFLLASCFLSNCLQKPILNFLLGKASVKLRQALLYI